MKLVVYQGIPDDASLRNGWNDCVQQMERPEIFFTYEWALAVSLAYKDSLKPLLFVGYEEETIVGGVALAIGPAETVFLNSATADYCDFVCDPKYRAQFVEAVFMELRRLGVPSLVLANLPADSITNVALGRVAKQEGYFIFSRPAYFCSEVGLSNEQQRRDVLSSARRRMKRFVKLLGPKASIRVEHVRSWGQIAILLPEFQAAHISRFRATGRVSNMVRPERQKFLEELACLLSGSASIVLSRLILNDRTIAWNYGFQFVGGWFWYQPTFDEDYEKYSPGVWLLSALLEEACLSPQINRVDLGLGDEGYKDRVATGGRKTVNVTASESFVQHTKVRFRYHAAMAVKSVPKVERLVRRLRPALEIESSKPSAA